MGASISGYIEAQKSGSLEWNVVDELSVGDIPRGPAVHLVFGYGSTSSSGALFKDRGLPGDISESVREDYVERQVQKGQGIETRDTFGHSHVYASELPGFVLERLPPLESKAQVHERTRLLVWFRR